MEDEILRCCRDGLRDAGYDNVELNPGGVYVEIGGKPYSVMVIECEEGENT